MDVWVKHSFFILCFGVIQVKQALKTSYLEFQASMFFFSESGWWSCNKFAGMFCHIIFHQKSFQGPTKLRGGFGKGGVMFMCWSGGWFSLWLPSPLKNERMSPKRKPDRLPIPIPFFLGEIWFGKLVFGRFSRFFLTPEVTTSLHSRKWTRIEDVGILLKMGIFQQAMLVFRGVIYFHLYVVLCWFLPSLLEFTFFCQKFQLQG